MDRFCQRCKTVIPEERLEALPETKLCVKCSQAVGSDFEVIIVEENEGSSVLSKPVIHIIEREIEPLENEDEY